MSFWQMESMKGESTHWILSSYIRLNFGVQLALPYLPRYGPNPVHDLRGRQVGVPSLTPPRDVNVIYIHGSKFLTLINLALASVL
jgi:hypothetical protein